MKCEYCHKREADRVFTHACCSKSYDEVAHLDEHYCSECWDNDETIEDIQPSLTAYPIENMSVVCPYKEHEESK